MNPKPIHLGEYNGRDIFVAFEFGKGYTGKSGDLSIGPLPQDARAKRAICDLIDAETAYLNAPKPEIKEGQPFPTFRESAYYKQVFEKYKLPLPKNE